jgi:2-phosphoglycerate kinase
VFKSGKPHSMILWGPPGVGKTTLARLTAYAFDCEFIALSAVLSGVKDIRAAIEQAAQPGMAASTPSCLSTRSTASTNRSRTPCCRSSNRAWSR